MDVSIGMADVLGELHFWVNLTDYMPIVKRQKPMQYQLVGLHCRLATKLAR